MSVRVAIVTESFPPDVNGVAHCVLRVAEHLVMRGHEPVVIAPTPAAQGAADPAGPFPCPVVRQLSVPMPGYRGFRIGVPTRALAGALAGHGAEVVHLASPFVLGRAAMRVATRLCLPTIAVYQTDVPAYARMYGLGRPGEAAAWRWLRRIHNAASRTLAPSAASVARLRQHGVQRVCLWGRGVDTQRFHPVRCSPRLRNELAPGGQVLVGYVGRLAPEKRVDLLRQVAAVPGVRLVIVGGGPAESALRRALPGAMFLGPRHGTELAMIYASLDVFVHCGDCETFGQTLQEAAASGLPVVAPAAGGPLDIVDHGRTGYLVAPGDPAAFGGAVARLARDPLLRAGLGRAGRAKMLSRSWRVLGDELIGHYRAVSGKTGEPAPAGRAQTLAAVPVR